MKVPAGDIEAIIKYFDEQSNLDKCEQLNAKQKKKLEQLGNFPISSEETFCTE